MVDSPDSRKDRCEPTGRRLSTSSARGGTGRRLLVLAARVACVCALLAAWGMPSPAGEWLPGDTHSHISPPDVPPKYNHAANNLDGAIAAAKVAGLKWIILTPHAMDRKDETSGRLWCVEMGERLAKRTAAEGDPLVVLGWERTYTWPGHMTVSFVDLEKVVGLPLEKLLAEVRRQKGLAFVAHPYQLPNFLINRNSSWRPWTEGPRGKDLDPWLSGLEVFHPISPALSAAARWDQWIAAERRRLVGVGATDDHWGTLYATTWVWVEGELTRDALRDGLRMGRVCVGSDASAGAFTVTSDRKAPDGNGLVGRIGDTVAADEQVTVTWEADGATLYVDGKPQRVDDKRFVHRFGAEARGSFHWYRLQAGIRSYSNPIYVNLPPQEEPPPPAGDAPKAARDEESERHAPSGGSTPTTPRQ
ncbi:MAG: hypothetical protein GXY74_02085 [Phycisphaerae bacterium]|nr:hypothetical protein [Phycisphaerae bacterium]